MDTKISVGGVLQDAWQRFVKDVSFVYYLIAPMLLCSVLGILLYPEFFYLTETSQVDPLRTLPSFLIAIAGLFAGFFFTVSLLFFVTTGKKDTWKDWQKYLRLLPKYVGVSILQGLMVLVGLIFFVIPGIYLALRYAFVGYRTLEHPTESVKDLFSAEAKATEGNRMTLFLIGLVLVVAAIAIGTLFSFVVPGYMSSKGNPIADFVFEFAVTPFFTFVSIVAYLHLTGRAEEKEKEPEVAVETKTMTPLEGPKEGKAPDTKDSKKEQKDDKEEEKEIEEPMITPVPEPAA